MMSKLRFKNFYKNKMNWNESEFLRLTRNNNLVLENLFHQIKVTKIEQQLWYKDYSKNSKWNIFIAYDAETQMRIGYINIISESILNRRVSMSIVVSPEFWNLGYEKKFIKWGTKECSKVEFDVHKISTMLFVDDLKCASYYNECGFEIDGIMREHIYTTEGYKDIYTMSIIVS